MTRTRTTARRFPLALALGGALLAAASPAAANDNQFFASDAAPGDHFGAVAAGDGFLAVGARNDDDLGVDSGSVYVFREGPGGWVQEDKVTALDGGPDDAFGTVVALSGDLLLVASPGDDDRGVDAGAAYVFRREGQFWVQQAKLLASNGAAGDSFGSSIALTADYAVIGAYQHGGNGAAYVFRRNGAQWTQEQMLTGGHGLFGFSVAASGEWIAVGGFEGVALFRETGGSWPTAGFLPPHGGPGAVFGVSVDMEDDRLIVGAWLDDQVASNAGAAHVYQRFSAEWSHMQKLVPSDGNANQFFGGNVSVAGERALVGSHADDDFGPNTGSAYLYGEANGAWSETEKIVPAGTAAWDGFGASVSLHGSHAAMGATGDDGAGLDAGTAFTRCFPVEDPGGTFDPGSFTDPIASACDCEVCEDPAAILEDVYGFNGEFHQQVTDLRIPGRGFDFVMGRTYRSRLGVTTAMGHGWDFSYNVRIEVDGADLVLHDGSGRRDRYELQPDGTWARNEFFRVLEQLGDGSFMLTFPDTSKWRMYPMNHGSAPGRLFEITDRNSNRMTMQYDAQGRLEVVRDTLHTASSPREVQFAYDASDRLVAVTDWVGRQVTYTYYGAGDPDGTEGDLATVTTPAIVPNGDFPLPAGAAHQFPNGRTTTYTYSTGFSAPELNSNLLTITDPLGQTWLQNAYAPTQDPADFQFDRLVRQETGSSGHARNFSYLPVTPAPGNGSAVVETIVNDRNGHVDALFYDDRNRLVLLQEFTGSWNPDTAVAPPIVPTTAELRASDPDVFETRYTYNDDSLPTEIVRPNGTVVRLVHELELDPSAARRSRGNLREMRRQPGTHAPVGAQAELVELFTYGAAHGGCCGTNFVASHTDARGNITTYSYDSRGNRTRIVHRLSAIVEDFEYDGWGQLVRHTWPADANGVRREDTFEYYLPSDGYQNGYLWHEIVDDAGAGITTVHEYDRVGNRVRTIDPAGETRDFVFNQMNHIVRALGPAYAAGGERPTVDTFYDGNDDVVRVETCNLDENGAPYSNAWLTETREYDSLRDMTAASVEIAPGTNERTEYEYDGEQHMILVRSGAATSGEQPTNEVAYAYDERDLGYRVVRAPASADASTMQFDYDGNRNVVRRVDGVGAQPREWTFVRDAYDRVVSATDPMGNVTETLFDANGNVGGDANGSMQNPYGVRLLGQENDVVGSSGNVSLGRVWYDWDAMDRRIYEDHAHFDVSTQTPIGDGSRTTTYAYAPNGLMTSMVEDDGGRTDFLYDTAQRLERRIEASGSEVAFTWDTRTLMRSRTFVDRSTSSAPTRTYRTTFDYDALGRLIGETDGEGNETRYGSDSRGNHVVVVDPRGNVTRQSFDGRSLLVETRRALHLGGTGSGPSAGEIVTRQAWDSAGRLVGRVDPAGNATTYGFDALDRQVLESFADGTSHATTFDVFGDAVETTDPNGTRVTTTFDRLGRPTLRQVLRASIAAGGPVDVLGTTQETFAYSGRSWTVRAQDDDSLVVRSHDSLGNVTLESLRIGTGALATTGITTATHDAEGNRTSLRYPGGRRIEFDFDPADRLRTVRDLAGGGSVLASYDFLGSLVERRGLGNGVQSRTTWNGAEETANAQGDRGFRRVSRVVHELGAATLQTQAYRWDRSGNRSAARTRHGAKTEVVAYDYDSASRLEASTSRIKGPAAGGLAQRGPTTELEYELDETGNRVRVTANGPTRWSGVGTYTMNGQLGGLADRQMNQYTNTPLGQLRYDSNGNLVRRVGSLEAAYDFRSRLVQVRDLAAGERHTYRFDALGRRIERALDVDQTPEITRYFYDGELCIEEQSRTGQTLATLVHGAFFDELVETTRGGVRYFALVDDLLSVTALTDTAGQVVERIVYGDFGEPLFLDGAGDPVPASTTGNPMLFTGRRHDPETGWYHVRTRMMDPGLGRFTSRDSIGIWGDGENAGNAFTYAANRPTVLVDPFGTLGGLCDFGKDLADSYLPWFNWKRRRLTKIDELKRQYCPDDLEYWILENERRELLGKKLKDLGDLARKAAGKTLPGGSLGPKPTRF